MEWNSYESSIPQSYECKSSKNNLNDKIFFVVFFVEHHIILYLPYIHHCINTRDSENVRTDMRKGVIGFVSQSFNLIDELNVYDNIGLPAP